MSAAGFILWGFRVIRLEFPKLVILEAVWRSLFLSDGYPMGGSVRPSLSEHEGLYEWVIKKIYILKMGAVGKPIRGTISVAEGGRLICWYPWRKQLSTPSGNPWPLLEQCTLHCFKIRSGMPLPIDFSVISPCETCLSYIFSFGWSSGGMNLLKAGLQGVLFKGGLVEFMMGFRWSWQSRRRWASILLSL